MIIVYAAVLYLIWAHATHGAHLWEIPGVIQVLIAVALADLFDDIWGRWSGFLLLFFCMLVSLGAGLDVFRLFPWLLWAIGLILANEFLIDPLLVRPILRPLVQAVYHLIMGYEP